MVQVLLVTGSARPNSANSKVVSVVKNNLEARQNVTVTVADLVELNLPFMDSPLPPSAPGYEITDEHVKQWQAMVQQADAVVFVMPEYNHSLSAIQKNAIDWLYTEWNDKPVALVAYGFYAGRHAIAQFEEINTVIKAKLDQTITGLQFNDDLEMDGTVKNRDAVDAKISTTLDTLIGTIG